MARISILQALICCLCAVLLACHGIPTRWNLERESRPVVISMIGANGKKTAFVMRNTSPEVVEYFHWFSLDSSPVPYCRRADQSVYFCGVHAMVDSADNPWIHEQFLPPGESVKFVAHAEGAEAVGVKLWLQGKEQFVWIRRSQ
jgi:hypothetical protein